MYISMPFPLKTPMPNRIIFRMGFLFLIVALTAFKTLRQSVIASVVRVGGQVLRPQKFGICELRNLKQVEIAAKDHSGKDQLFKASPWSICLTWREQR